MKEIPLTQGKVALVDDGDYEKINRSKWYSHHRGNTNYAERGGGNKKIFMHHEILSIESRQLIDHIDGNGLNNQKSNLRFSSKRENAQNMHIPKTSRFPGVSFDKRTGKWIAFIRINGKKKNLGRFLNEEDAFCKYKQVVDSL